VGILRDPHKDQPILQGGAPLAEAAAAMILLHGRNGSAQDMLALARDLDASPPSPEGRGGQGVRTACFVPEARDRQWYPFSLLEKVERNRPALNSALALVKRIMEKIAATGIPPERVVLLGFSQGASVALEFAARNPQRYGALIALSGALLGPEGTPRDYAGSLDGTPLFLGSGDADAHLPKRRVDETAQVFERLGATVTRRVYPGLGHAIHPDEVVVVREMLDV
jgi:predicted esterase